MNSTAHHADAPTEGAAVRRPVALAATIALLAAGLSLAAYALTAFAVPDWTVAGPGLLVATAGIIGLKVRVAYLAGLVPIAAVLSIAARIVTYDLARPNETPYFIGTLAIAVGACFAAVLGVTAAVAPGFRRSLPIGLGLSAIVCAATFGTVASGNEASRATDAGITDTERQSANVIDMVDYAFHAPEAVPDGAIIHLRNTGALPHQLDVPALNLTVFVPSGRDTYLRLPRTNQTSIGLICPVGDHQQRGMGLDLQLLPGTPKP